MNIINKNLHIIKPIRIVYNNYLLFSNITLCKKNIILTTMHYIKEPLNLDDINIIVKNQKNIKKIIYDNSNLYEPSLIIVLELENIVSNISLLINYKNKNYQVHLDQHNIIDHSISAMTLFKDDFFLLKRYLKYYKSLGIDIFYIYYNNKIDSNIINNIKEFNKNESIIYLIEWNYVYKWNDHDFKHHFAQTMAINDSLHILKNYSNYILYNDLDEYFLMNKYENFNDLINKHSNIDIFIFKNRFCKLGNELIKYKDFDTKFDLSNIIEGNYWDIYREKNLIKCKYIDIMGIHFYFKYNNIDIKEMIVDQFYHIINFEEKNRENLMTEYI